MNLFVTDFCPIECAIALDDKRVGKLLMEANQMLSLAVKLCDDMGPEPTLDDMGPGKVCFGYAHRNHPVSIWVRTSYSNFLWTARHARALGDEYQYRFGKPHASADRTEYIMKWFGNRVPAGEMTPFQNSARNAGKGLDFSHLPVYEAYRTYLRHRWQTDVRPVLWSRRDPPSWYELEEVA